MMSNRKNEAKLKAYLLKRSNVLAGSNTPVSTKKVTNNMDANVIEKKDFKKL